MSPSMEEIVTQFGRCTDAFRLLLTLVADKIDEMRKLELSQIEPLSFPQEWPDINPSAHAAQSPPRYAVIPPPRAMQGSSVDRTKAHPTPRERTKASREVDDRLGSPRSGKRVAISAPGNHLSTPPGRKAHPSSRHDLVGSPVNLSQAEPMDGAIALCLQFSQLYSNKVGNPVGGSPGGTNRSSAALQTWTARDVRDGDLLNFSIPIDDVGPEAFEALLARCKRHTVASKKALVTTPRCSRSRRWFLYDMFYNVMPRVHDAVFEWLILAKTHGTDLLNPLELYLQRGQGTGAPPDMVLQPGNMIDALEYVKAYYNEDYAAVSNAGFNSPHKGTIPMRNGTTATRA
eukprot:TRINITY_DN19923_c0_g1_i1.p1 TRINITY_DN19923_c0_g1~~TRINITY_DN19923_c0_g1_i1.p1  ORF type:complete len:345 (+),score=32.16 TRINITY_DN19923_c0_g1_i1:69-1103(+)